MYSRLNDATPTRFEFLPYGEAATDPANADVSQGEWAGMTMDNARLYYARNRYYHPLLGRFISQDPIGLAGGINPYMYCHGDPINFIDPMGLDGWYIGTNPDYPWFAGDSESLAHSYETGRHAAASGISLGLYDGGAYKCEIGFGESQFLGKVGASAALAYGAARVAASRAGRWGARAGRRMLGAAAEVGDTLADWWNGSCFVAGTPVTLADGTTKPIEQIVQTDLVSSRAESGIVTSGKQVTQTFKHTVHELATAEFTQDGDTSGKVAETITGTVEHPFFVVGQGWVPLAKLGVGSKIVTRAGPCLVVKSIRTEKKPEGVAVYNLEIEDYHTYFVGTGGAAWVHNIGDCVENLPVSKIAYADPVDFGSMSASERAAWKALLGSIRDNGIQSPVDFIEHPESGLYWILDGNHRGQAAEFLKLDSIPGIRRSLPFGVYKTWKDISSILGQ